MRCDLDSNILVNSLYSHHFISVINKPTRFPTITSHTPSLLDHIWTNNLNYSDSGIVLSNITDHCPSFINFKFDSSNNVSSSRTKISFRVSNETCKTLFDRALQNYNWNSLMNDDINVYVENFIKALNDLYNECFPLKTKFISTNHVGKPWITPQILKLSKMKSQYYKMCQLGILSVSENNLFKNKVVRIIRKNKTRYYESAFARNKTNIKGTWILINELASREISQSKIKSIIWNNVEFYEDCDIAEKFSEYFSTVAPALNLDIPNSMTDPLSYITTSVPRSIFLSPILPDECEKIVRSLRNTKENNFIPVSIFKSYIASLLPTLCKMINQMFSTGTFPNYFKVATITPIHKKGAKSSPSNYRPISVLPCLSKLFEKCILLRLSKFISKENLIAPSQYGFVNKRSTVDAIVDLTEYIYTSLNSKQITISVMIDFQKAFDTINHRILLSKLEKYGIRGLTLQLISSFLANRSNIIRINSSFSQPKPLPLGLPQGSVLSPILFILYINDLTKLSKNFKPILYADDTTLCFINQNPSIVTQTCNLELDKFLAWTRCNRLSINFEKSCILIFSNIETNPVSNVQLGGYQLSQDNNLRFLGIILDDKLKFDTHIQYIATKISKSIGILYRIKDYVPDCILKSIYYSLIYPYLSYGIIIWGGTYQTHLNPLVILQKRAIRLINKQPYLAHTNNLFFQNKILKLNDIYKFHLGIYFYKNQLADNFTRNHNHATRNRDLLLPPFNRLVSTSKSVYESGARIWNEIPSTVQNASSLPSFKHKLKSYYIEQYNQA